MKILRIIARLNVGGPARHVVWLMQALQGDGFESKLIAGTVPEGEEDMSYFAAEHGVRPIFVEEMSRELSITDAISLLKIYRILKDERPDIVHTHTAKAGTVGRTAAFLYRWFTWGTLIGRPRKVKVVHTFHGHVFHSYYGKWKTRVFVLIEKTLAFFATDMIIVITPQQLREIHEEFRVGSRNQFEVVPLGIDLAAFNGSEAARTAFRSEIGVDAGEFLIGFVGRLTEIKNIPLLLKAAKGYLDSPDSPATRFVIVGDGHLRGELEKLTTELGLSASVVFAGNRDDVNHVYSALDIVALTSLNEGTPLSLIEAMAAKRPVISTKVGGVVDLLGDAVEEIEGFLLCERGISVPSDVVDIFANGLLYLVKNERLRVSLGEKSHQFVVSKYAKERLITDVKDLYVRILNE